VSRFEENLILILRFFLKRTPAASALPLIFASYEAPRCLNRDAVTLVQDTLAKGCAHLLARSGGWRRERFLRSGQAVEGRLWERTEPQALGLAFSRHTLRWLLWITAEDVGDKKSRWPVPAEDAWTAGDLLLCFYAFEALRDDQRARPLWRRPPFDHHGLCRLAYPEDAIGPEESEPAFAPWLDGPGASILEALQDLIARRWVEAERSKGRPGRDWSQMQALGRRQESLLTSFLDAVEAAGRPDLARFLLAALAELLPEHATLATWTGALHGAGPRLADRVETHRAALVLLRQVERLRQWQRWAQGVGYFDEGYGLAQFWLSEWERWQGETLHARAQALLRQVQPLSTQGASQ
jgi:hypothetical protein